MEEITLLTTRKRFRILLFVLISMGITLGAILLGRVLNINAQDPLFFDRLMYVKYNYNNGTNQGTLTFQVTTIHADRTTVTCSFLDQIEQFNVTKDGRMYDSGTLTANQSVFWIHIILGTGSEFEDYLGVSYNIFDPIGLLGPANSTYTLTITAYTNYWPLAPPILGAQASMKYVIKDLTNTIVATGLLDRTCGLIFTMNIGAGELRTLEIIDTNYDISRNRIIGMWWALPLAFIVPILSYLIFWKVPKLKVEEKDERIEMVTLIACGETAFMVDMMNDIWFYAIFQNIWGNLLLHCIVVGAFAAICMWRKYGLKWIIPGILECIFIPSMYLADHVTYVPYMTAFMGILMSYILMVVASGYKKQESTTKLGKLISEFI